MSPRIRLALWILLVCPALVVADPTATPPTSLDTYVNAPDPSFTYSLMGTRAGLNGTTIYTYDMTSQTWNGTQTDTSVWHHTVQLVVPQKVTSTTGTLWIDGGSNPINFNFANQSTNGLAAPTPDEVGLSQIASRTGSIVTILSQVPNEPIRFQSDPNHPRSEDSAIAQSLMDYVTSGGQKTTAPLLIPMVKAAKEAMDLTQQVVHQLPPPVTNPYSSPGIKVPSSQPQNDITINDFVVSGASKRGWTTWLTGAVDDRVKAISPVVFDALNLNKQLPAYGQIYDKVSDDVISDGSHQYPAKLTPYVDLSGDGTVSLTRIFSNPELYPEQIVKAANDAINIIDPYAYKDRYADMPKYSVNAAGDEFFANISSNNYFNEMPGPKWIRYIPNAGHGVATDFSPLNPANQDNNSTNDDVNMPATDTFIEGFTAYLTAQITGEVLPEYSWTITPSLDGLGVTISVQFTNGVLPDHMRVWYADNQTAPDFRFNRDIDPTQVAAALWTSIDIDMSTQSPVNGLFQYTMNLPSVGFREFYLDFDYQLRNAPESKYDYFELGSNAIARRPYFYFSSGIALMDSKGLFFGPTGDALTANFIASVPETSSIVMAGFGLACMAVVAARRYRKAG